MDGPYRVREWPKPGARPPLVDVPEGAPSWWRGEAEASDSFFRGMGLKLVDGQWVRPQ